jgi:hypothetical protein
MGPGRWIVVRRPFIEVVAPLVVIAAGVLLLLNTLGVVPWDIWNDVGRWWPALIILLGLGVLIQNVGRRGGHKT